MNDFLEITIAIVIIVLITILFMVGVAVAANPLERKSCLARWGSSGMEVRYSFWEDCQLRLPDGTWIPAKSYRPVKETK